MKKIILMIMMVALLAGCSCNRGSEVKADSQVEAAVLDSIQTPVDSVTVDTLTVTE